MDGKILLHGIAPFFLHKASAVAEDGYYYYIFVNKDGNCIVERIKSDYSEFLFKQGDKVQSLAELTSVWGERTVGTYLPISAL